VGQGQGKELNANYLEIILNLIISLLAIFLELRERKKDHKMEH
jgi:hypothetical protein